MSGRAVFRPRPDGVLHYAEKGMSELRGETPMRFTRSYLYVFNGDALSILFDEAVPRSFQETTLVPTLSGWRGSGYHACPPDTYVSQYRFDSGGGFWTRHEVEGPRKSYIIETSFVRSGTT